MAIMNAKTAWHWGQGDHDADISDGEEADGAEMLALEGSSDLLELTYQPEEDSSVPVVSPSPPPELDSSSGLVVYRTPGELGESAGSSMVTYHAHEIKVRRKKRAIIGSEAVRKSAVLVPRAAEDCLSNEKLQPVSSGRGFALLEKMGWKKGQGLGRDGSGTILPVAAPVKSDMGGLASKEEKCGLAPKLMPHDGPELQDANFQVDTSSMLAAVQAASMDSEFSNIVSQTRSVQQINEENRRMTMDIPATASAPAASNSTRPHTYGFRAYAPPQSASKLPVPSAPTLPLPNTPAPHDAACAARSPWAGICGGHMHQSAAAPGYGMRSQGYPILPQSGCGAPTPPYAGMMAYGMHQAPSYTTRQPGYGYPTSTMSTPAYEMPCDDYMPASGGAYRSRPGFR